jgi:hypothetical protein
MTELSWNPEQPGQLVRMRNDPGKQGTNTGKVVKSAGRLLVEVDFGPNEKKLRKFEQLELVVEVEGFQDLLKKGAMVLCLTYDAFSFTRRSRVSSRIFSTAWSLAIHNSIHINLRQCLNFWIRQLAGC